MYEFKFPFEPPMEDLRMTVEGKNGTCYIFDTCCKNFSAEDKARTDRAILDIYARALSGKHTPEAAGFPSTWSQEKKNSI